MASKQFHGLHVHRYGDNPQELKAADLWEKENLAGQYTWHEDRSILGYLLSVDNKGTIPSPRDWLVANTVIQWLATPVGRHFLWKLNELVNSKGKP
jgi:hypothetical protein